MHTMNIEPAIISMLTAYLDDTWRAGTTYAAGDLATRDGMIYRCLTTATNEEPGDDAEHWLELIPLNPQAGRAYTLAETFPCVYLYMTNLQDAFHLGGGNSGILEGSLIIQAQTFALEDKQASTLALLAEALRHALYRQEITSLLQAEAEAVTLFNFTVDQDFTEPTRDGIRLHTFACSLRLSPTAPDPLS